MRKIFLFFMLTLILSILLIPQTIAVGASSQIRAVLFFSDTCPHCKDVIEYVLPPLVEKYPGQLDIVGIQVDHPVGSELYQNMLTVFSVPDNRIGVPTLVVGSKVLVGTFEIESTFPEIINNGLASGGIDWPEIPGLEPLLAAQPKDSSQIAMSSPGSLHSQTGNNFGVIDRFMQDPIANAIAVIVLFGMIAAGTSVIVNYLQGSDHKFLEFPGWALPALAVVGLGVAVYMSYVEATHIEAVCGPVGNCNTVQQSSYSRLFGILPIGTLGAVGYLAILISWLLSRFGPDQFKKLFTLAVWAMGWFGLLFSIYLTFLEPFVIGATCVWCITSAIIITLILLAATSPTKDALRIEEMDEGDVQEENTDLIAEFEVDQS